MIKYLYIIALLFSLCSSCNSLKEKEMHLFILMGQSNMSGYGDVLPQDTVPVEGIYYIPTIGEKPYTCSLAKHPLHNRLKSDGFGLGIPFAKKYKSDHEGIDVGLIPVAWGGVPIEKLNKGTEIYNDAIQKVLVLMKREPRVKLKGILWHHGESNTITEELVVSYERKLHQLISDLRMDLQSPKLPFIVGNLAEFYGTGVDHSAPIRVKQINTIKQVLRDIPQKIDNGGFVESTDCKSHDKHQVHFDRESYIILGERYAEEMNRLSEKASKN